MDTTQNHFGRKFYQDKKTGYWISTDYPRIRAHRWVWISVNGDIPKKHHIHHKDRNKSNNDISNLQLISHKDHAKEHMSEEASERSRKWVAEIRPLTKKWHRSEKGIEWHKQHAKKFKFGKVEPYSRNCDTCNQEYQARRVSGARFCSNNCKSEWRRRSGIDNEERKCLKCGTSFQVNRYAVKKFCNKYCAKKF